MRRDQLAAVGIQLPVLPTIVLGALPGASDWALRLERLGLDVVATGAARDTPQTLSAAVAAVPHRPLKAMGALTGAPLVECEGEAPRGAYRVHRGDGVVILDGVGASEGADELASCILGTVREDPSAWWVAATGLADEDPAATEERLAVIVEAVRRVRLFLAKQQFD